MACRPGGVDPVSANVAISSVVGMWVVQEHALPQIKNLSVLVFVEDLTMQENVCVYSVRCSDTESA